MSVRPCWSKVLPHSRLRDTLQLVRRWQSSSRPLSPTDAYGIPTRPTWSVNELLSSYPQPSIPPSTFEHLHKLSALVPPKEGTPEYKKLKKEMEDLVKLVEAVKLVDTSEVKDSEEVPDGRIWADGVGIELNAQPSTKEGDKMSRGRDLMKHAAKTSNGMYIVESEKMK